MMLGPAVWEHDAQSWVRAIAKPTTTEEWIEAVEKWEEHSRDWAWAAEQRVRDEFRGSLQTTGEEQQQDLDAWVQTAEVWVRSAEAFRQVIEERIEEAKTWVNRLRAIREPASEIKEWVEAAESIVRAEEKEGIALEEAEKRIKWAEQCMRAMQEIMARDHTEQ